MCVLTALGWMDSEGERINATIMEDIATLPSSVSEELDQDAIAECAMEMVEEWYEDDKIEK